MRRLSSLLFVLTATSCRVPCLRHVMDAATRAAAVLLLVVAGGCASRPMPAQTVGTLAELAAAVAWMGARDAAGSTVLVDSVAWGRVAALTGDALGEAAWHAALPSRTVRATDSEDVLVCPDRAPCHVQDDATWLSAWDAQLADGALTLVVNRTWNVQRLYPMTESAAHRMTLRREGARWRLVSVQRLPT